MTRVLLLSTLFSLLLLSACATPPPQNQADACSIFEEHRSWYKATRKVEKKWGVPISLQLAFIKQESSFRHNAKPARGKFLFIFPGARPSTAEGYAQALDTTWDAYKKATSNRGANRRNFKDAVDFIGWYVHSSHQRAGIPKGDAYGHYLAYHEGAGGYIRGSYKTKPAVKAVATKVARDANQYDRQLDKCEKKFRRGIPLIPFV
ncbi:MAG: transglycosylase SLT domain-containing protein [bacterium]